MNVVLALKPSRLKKEELLLFQFLKKKKKIHLRIAAKPCSNCIKHEYFIIHHNDSNVVMAF